MNKASFTKSSAFRRDFLGALVAVVGLTLGSMEASAITPLEERAAPAAGAAAGRAADRAIQNAVLHGAIRYRWPACRAGAHEFRSHGFSDMIFMRECLKVL